MFLLRNVAIYFACLVFTAIGTTNTCSGEKYALLVGVKRYIRTELTSLNYTENDVTEIAKTLRSNGYDTNNVILMTQTVGSEDPELLPTSQNIKDQIELILADLTPNDTVLIAFSGHGIQMKGQKESFFCPMDARLKKRSTLISITTVFDQLEKCKAAGKILMVDACRNDPLSNFAKSARVELEPVSNRRAPVLEGGTIAFLSCAPTQESFEDPKLKRGVFFYFVNEALSGKGDIMNNGDVTFDELKTYAMTKTKDYVRAQLRRRQVPAVVSKNEVLGEIVLLKKLPALAKRLSMYACSPFGKL